MTAVNVIVRPDRAFLMTDGAFYTPDGRIIALGNKALPIANLNAAIAVRGLQAVVPIFALDFSIRYVSFDDMIDRVADDLRVWHENRAHVVDESGWFDVELYIVGWSEAKQCAQAFSITTRDYGDGEEPCTLRDCGRQTIAPGLSEEEETVRLPQLGVHVDARTFERDFDPARHGIAIMEAQRRALEQLSFVDEPFCSIGGHISCTEVGKDGVRQRVIHRWAQDKPGQAFEPEPFKLVAPIVADGLSRAERRRQEKLRRRARH